MKNITSKALCSVLLAGGLTVLGTGAAHAIDLNLGGDDGLLSGLDLTAVVEVPLTVIGNSIGVIGGSNSGSSTGSTPAAPATPPSSNAVVTVTVPITVKDNAISAIGDANNGNSSGVNGGSPVIGVNAAALLNATVPTILGLNGTDGWLLGPGEFAIGDIGTGLSTIADVSVPVTVENNAVSVLGDSNSGNGVTEGSTGILGNNGLLGDVELFGDVNLLGDVTSNGLLGLLSDSEVLANVGVPISLECNGIAVIGTSTSGCATATGDPDDPDNPDNPDNPGEAGTPGASGGGLAGTGAEVTGALTIGAIALLLGIIVTVAQRRFGLGG